MFERYTEKARRVIFSRNGREWLCLECYEKFWERPDFISGSYSEIT